MAICDFPYLLLLVHVANDFFLHLPLLVGVVADGFFDHMLVVLAHVAGGHSTGLAVVLVHRDVCDSSRLPVVLVVAPLGFVSHPPVVQADVPSSCRTCGVVNLLACPAQVADVFSGCYVGRMALGFSLHVPEGSALLSLCFVLHRLCFVWSVAGDDSPSPLAFQAPGSWCLAVAQVRRGDGDWSHGFVVPLPAAADGLLYS